jgi:hypothetical protein
MSNSCTGVGVRVNGSAASSEWIAQRGGNFFVNKWKSKASLKAHNDESVWNTFSAISHAQFFLVNPSATII